jgi:branched-chain amino acid transport system permease protein
VTAVDPTIALDTAPIAAEAPNQEQPAGPSVAGWIARGAAWAFLAWLVLLYPGNIASPFEVPAFDANRMSEAVIFAIIGLSLNVLIGYAGQVSLGHQAFVGIGAFTSAYVVTDLTQ